MALQIPSIPLFKPYGDQNTVAQRWTQWKKSFNNFIRATNITDNARKQALLIHSIAQDTEKKLNHLILEKNQRLNVELILMIISEIIK